MAIQPLLPPPLLAHGAHPGDDSASNQGSSVAEDLFDDDCSSVRTSRDSVSIPGSLAGDSQDEANDHHTDDEDYSWIAADDMVILRAMSSSFSSSPNCDAAHAASARSRPRDGRATMYHQRRHQQLQRPQHQPHRPISRLPRGTKPVRLVGEGAANAVFEIQVPPHLSQRVSSKFQGVLLRVAKVPALGHAPTFNYLLQQKFYHTAIEPVLGKHAVRQELVILHNCGIVDKLNALLREIDHTRKAKFRGTFVGQADWGFLVEDMRPEDPDQCVLVEFKPKWLSQSPSAPSNAIRCRQCAMELCNMVQSPATRKPCPEKKPCPLALGNRNAPSQVASPFRIAPQLATHPAHRYYEKVLDGIANHDAIHELKAQQDRLDLAGPLTASPTDPFFALAMTLRDCTCFAQIPADHSAPVKIRLGDFDWKDPKIKIGHWRGTEADLINGGFYTAEWILCNNVFYHPPTRCLLECVSGKRNGKPDILLLEEVNPAKRNNSLRSNHAVSQTQSELNNYYTHTTDVETLMDGLQRFKKEPEGTPLCNVYNPLRSNPN